jgi:hypothetical protein
MTARAPRRPPASRSPATARAVAAAPSPRAAGGADRVALVTPSGSIDVEWPGRGTKALPILQQQAMRWSHVVRNRARWAAAPALALDQDARARELLQGLGVSESQRQQLAEAGTIRVSIPFKEERYGWEARILPWEFLLPAATRDIRSAPLVVTRSLLCNRPPGRAAYRKVLFVESAPGRLSQDWDFEDERRLVERYTGHGTKADPKRFKRLPSPSRSELAAALAEFRPDVVHLAGFDTHQGLELVKDSRADQEVDGYLMAARGGVDPVPAAEVAALIATDTFAPSLVFCNLWNSAARIAPLLVANGVRSAVGFQDSIDDALAEMFLGSFYRALTETADVDIAFQVAWQALQTQPKPLNGTGIVLWHGGALQAAKATTAKTGTVGRPVGQPLSSETFNAEMARQMLAVTVEPEPQFSYGLLHNNRDLFQRFVVRNLSEGTIVGLQVFVELHSNEGTYPYRQSFNIEDPVLDLSRQVRIALTSHLARTLDEVLRTSLYVEVTWGEHEIFRQTFPVTMAPVDQWTDTDADRIFLPSFIFPRDRAVSTVIRNGEHFVTALRDDPAAGFDGYQSLDPELANPAENVDRQVQALWYSVVYRVPASYINPPPTYAVASQRIRTPSEIVAGGFGTCIDLALMLASCLEAIEIHPVVFLLEDHAFPGYWRTDAARAAFCRRVASSASNPGTTSSAVRGEGASAKRRPGAPWCFDAAALTDIKLAIDRNQLVPLESVGLTGRWSFADAATEGRTYFDPDQQSRFLLMLDVKTSRERGVTPLPLGPRLE